MDLFWRSLRNNFLFFAKKVLIYLLWSNCISRKEQIESENYFEKWKRKGN